MMINDAICEIGLPCLVCWEGAWNGNRNRTIQPIYLPFNASENFLNAEVEDLTLPEPLFGLSFIISENVITLPSIDLGFLFL